MFAPAGLELEEPDIEHIATEVVFDELTKLKSGVSMIQAMWGTGLQALPWPNTQ